MLELLPLPLRFGGFLEEGGDLVQEFFLFAGALAFAVGDFLEEVEGGGSFLGVEFREAGFQKTLQVLEDYVLVLQQEAG